MTKKPTHEKIPKTYRDSKAALVFGLRGEMSKKNRKKTQKSTFCASGAKLSLFRAQCGRDGQAPWIHPCQNSHNRLGPCFTRRRHQPRKKRCVDSSWANIALTVTANNGVCVFSPCDNITAHLLCK